ncbi:hypothetical protein ATEIFO6365_0009011900 [Aspergillus terreus]|uniref:Heterokaryon incompatibility domain-containing protein n=1 Tax=Aspergillus terreus TaxID=33178 RepID=A0A5M3Z7I4_ASPTE|nr:hypothetical protein ATETN484_0011011900 [Aspergillus terreus]GFF18756.1 hypothetical protein ATEIFO6365_0009011900 [Aspergillus terreus]
MWNARQPPPQSYRYEALEQSDAIRLLVLQPGTGHDPVSVRLIQARLSSSPKFEAISYNLHAALQQFRLPHAERVLWADAICINQTDLGEKNTQVPLMKDIYSKASAVLVWLGSGSPKLERGLDALAQLHVYFCRHLKHYNDDTKYRRRLLGAAGRSRIPIQSLSLKDSEELRKLDWDAISGLLSLPWFGRVWTLQEIVNAKEAVLVCGGRTASFHKFARPIVEFFLQYVDSARTLELGLTINFPINSVWSVMETSRLRASRASNLDKTTLYELVRRHNLRQCTDPRDKIYGFLGLATDQTANDQPFLPQYNLPVETIYRDFALWSITVTRSLDMFSSIRDYRVHSSLKGLPSWVPDWMDWGGRRDTESFETSTWYVVDRIERLAVSYYQMTIWDDYRHYNYVKQLKAGVTGAARGKMIAQFSSEGLPEHYLDGLLEAGDMVQKYSIPGKTSTAVLRDIVWIENCKDIATRGTGQMSTGQYEAFWRTISGAEVEKDVPAPRWFKWTFKKHLQLLSDLREGKRRLDYGMAPFQIGGRFGSTVPLYHAGPKPVLYDDEYRRWDEVRASWACNRRRRFCATEKGRLGWAPEAAQEGDLICIFHGAKVPYVIRPCEDGNYILLGAGYLHGMMHGEVLKMKDMKEEELRIC